MYRPSPMPYVPPPLPPPRPLRPWRLAGKVFSLGLAALALFVAVSYLEENRRGARAWAACERELTARGETMDWQRFVPPPVPDRENLALAPLFARMLDYQIDPKTHEAIIGPTFPGPSDYEEMRQADAKPSDLAPGGWDMARPTDLAAYQRFYRDQSGFPHAETPGTPAADVLVALRRYGPVLDELARAAAERPRTRFPALWEADDPVTIRLPQYTLQLRFVQALRLRASALLAAGQAEDALRDLKLCWRLCEDNSREPVLIGHLIEITLVNLTLTPVWEGLAERRWSPAQLARIEARLQRLDLLTSNLTTHRGERVFFLRGLDFAERHRNLPKWAASLQSFEEGSKFKPNAFESWLYSLIPRGWFDLDKAIYARHMQQYYIDVTDPAVHHRTFLPPGTEQRAADSYPITRLLTLMTIPVFVSVDVRCVRMQTALDEAATACALERFFLDHRSYPATLGELVPGYLTRVPTDVIDGAPLRYRPLPDGRYQLYGVGWNQSDDGGRVAWNEHSRPDQFEGDWVWQYTELQPPAPRK